MDAPTGMYTFAVDPTSDAASATPCAWLPADAATTPAAFSCADSRAIRTYAPRILNDPVRCRFSHLRCTGPPTAWASGLDDSIGVYLATPCNNSAAALTSATVICASDTSSAWTGAIGLLTRGTCSMSSILPATATWPQVYQSTGLPIRRFGRPVRLRHQHHRCRTDQPGFRAQQRWHHPRRGRETQCGVTGIGGPKGFEQERTGRRNSAADHHQVQIQQGHGAGDRHPERLTR